MRMDQDLDAWLGVVKLRLDRETLLIRAAAPVVAGDGKQMRVTKVGDEGQQPTILEDGRASKKK